MTASKHTWEARRKSEWTLEELWPIWAEHVKAPQDGKMYARSMLTKEEYKDARAAVFACKGINPEAVPKLMEACKGVNDAWSRVSNDGEKMQALQAVLDALALAKQEPES